MTPGNVRCDAEVCPRVWAALTGAHALEQLTWDAWDQENAYFVPCPSPLSPSLPLGFRYEPLALPSLQQLSVRAAIISLPAAFCQLPSLTALHLAGQCLALYPGCLPSGLVSLSADWLPRQDPSNSQPKHVGELAAAASRCSRLEQLSLAGALSIDGLGAFEALTSLKWTRGYISNLQVLTLSDVWCEGQEVVVLPEPGNKLTILGLDARSLAAQGASQRLVELGSLEHLSVLHVVAGAAGEGAVGYSTSQSMLVEVLRTAVEVLPRLRSLHVHAYGHWQSWQQSPTPAARAAASAAAAAGEGLPMSFATPLRRKPEVLAPAGGWPQLQAAVENGADAVYFGLSDFNARARASNFEPQELPVIMSYLHDRGVKAYVVLNVLVFDEELATVAERAQQMEAAGVDAVIDIGVVSLIRRVAPRLPIHGSTQMSITSREGARFAAARGVSRVVVGRELSIGEIARMAAASRAPGSQRSTTAGAPAPAAAGAALATAAAGDSAPVTGRHGLTGDVEGAATGDAEASSVPEIEAFVHGALCVSYSGQCFSSEAWGGRSANRGQCAQACRMPYGLLVNGQLRDLQDVKYLLSPQDLAAVELVPQLIQAGVTCLKIEGRLKGPEYVALTTAVYRRAVDAAWETLQSSQGAGADSATSAPKSAAAAAGSGHRAAGTEEAAAGGLAAEGEAGRLQLSREEWQDLRQVFARGQDGAHPGLTPGFLEGPRHQQLVRGRAPRHRGNFAGTVLQVTREGVVVELACPIKRGDGLVFDHGDPQAKEEGGQVYEIRTQAGGSLPHAPAGQTVQLLFGRGQVNLSRLRPGHLAWRNKDSALDARLRASYEGLPAVRQRRLPVRVQVSAAAGAPLEVLLTDPEGVGGRGESPVAAAAAQGRGLGEEEVRKAVGVHLGGEGALVAADWDFSGCDFGAGLFLPASAIKEARRLAVAALMAARQHGRGAGAHGTAGLAGEAEQSCEAVLGSLLRELQRDELSGETSSGPGAAATGAAPPTLRVLCRSKAQVDAALRLPWLAEVILDFLEVHGLREACAAVRAGGKRLVVATPRILKPGEEALLHFYLRLQADALLLRGAGSLQQLLDLGGPGAAVPALGEGVRVPMLEGDFSLNASNALSAGLLLRSGLSRLAPTHDCNGAQVEAMARALGHRSHDLELVLHHHLPIFHTEHCVFARFLSDGNSFRDCGHPCEKNAVHLRDSAGADHLVLADQGCRNTVFNAQAQTGLPLLPALLSAGLTAFRVELVDEPGQHVAPLLEAYRQALLAAHEVSQQAQQRGGGVGRATQQAQRAQRGWEEAQRRTWAVLQGLPDANGRAHGAGLGSLEVRGEKAVMSLKPTAAAQKAARY
ncbi:hypothetical protein N2152v2_003118 [Parachlorella kessleri]